MESGRQPLCGGRCGQESLTDPQFTWSNATNPPAILPNGFDGGEIAAIQDAFGRTPDVAFFQVMVSVAGANRHKLKDTRVAITVNHATRAAVANNPGLIK